MPKNPTVGEHYIHYRTGKKYRVIGVGRHSETGEQLVVYEAQYTDAEFPLGQVWCRPLEMFVEDVEYQGKMTRRFDKAT